MVFFGLISYLFPVLYFPFSFAFVVATFMLNIGLALLIYALASFNFAYIQIKAQPWLSSGSAEPVSLTSDLTKFRLGVEKPGNIYIIVNLKKLPWSSHFLSRWVCYRVESHQLELWQDHPLFGSKWYYIEYEHK